MRRRVSFGGLSCSSDHPVRAQWRTLNLSIGRVSQTRQKAFMSSGLPRETRIHVSQDRETGAIRILLLRKCWTTTFVGMEESTATKLVCESSELRRRLMA